LRGTGDLVALSSSKVKRTSRMTCEKHRRKKRDGSYPALSGEEPPRGGKGAPLRIVKQKRGEASGAEKRKGEDRGFFCKQREG